MESVKGVPQNECRQIRYKHFVTTFIIIKKKQTITACGISAACLYEPGFPFFFLCWECDLVNAYCPASPPCLVNRHCLEVGHFWTWVTERLSNVPSNRGLCSSPFKSRRQPLLGSVQSKPSTIICRWCVMWLKLCTYLWSTSDFSPSFELSVIQQWCVSKVSNLGNPTRLRSPAACSTDCSTYLCVFSYSSSSKTKTTTTNNHTRNPKSINPAASFITTCSIPLRKKSTVP